MKTSEREGPPTPTPYPPIKGPSGEHPIMQEVRARLESLNEKQLPELEAVIKRIDRLKETISSPPGGDSLDKEEVEEKCPDTLPEKKESDES